MNRDFWKASLLSGIIAALAMLIPEMILNPLFLGILFGAIAGWTINAKHQTQCPYKGTASYYSIKTGKTELENAVWTYQNPTTEARKIKNLLAFYTEKIENVFVDGVR